LREYERAAVERYLRRCDEEKEKGGMDKKALNGLVLVFTI